MSGDRLAQIETAVEITLRRSRDSAGSEPEFVVAPSSVSCADVLALVEIATKARELDNALWVTVPKSAQPWLRKLVPLKNLRFALEALNDAD